MAISKKKDNIKAHIERFRISNFLSLHDVVLPLKPLTVLVGPNGSGKSNIIAAFSLLNELLSREDYPEGQMTIEQDWILRRLWAGAADSNVLRRLLAGAPNAEILLRLETKINGKHADYEVRLNPLINYGLSAEKLVVDSNEVISVKEGQGIVRDEDSSNPTDYKSARPALKSAGDYGNKPITSVLNKFISNWGFFDFKPDVIRNSAKPYALNKIKEMAGSAYHRSIRGNGSNLHTMLTEWHEIDRELFDSVCEAFSRTFRGNVKMECLTVSSYDDLEHNEIVLSEGYPIPISFQLASDGALRVLAYHVLNHQPDIPSLIVIEEPEKNFHPAWLPILKDILEQLSEKTQVIVSTHSSQLLDTFSSKALKDNLNVLLLRNIRGSGTQMIQLDDIQKDRDGLKGWIKEFGIGSAIFDSELLQDITEA